MAVHEYPQLVGKRFGELHFYFPCELLAVRAGVQNSGSEASHACASNLVSNRSSIYLVESGCSSARKCQEHWGHAVTYRHLCGCLREGTPSRSL